MSGPTPLIDRFEDGEILTPEEMEMLLRGLIFYYRQREPRPREEKPERKGISIVNESF